MRAEHLTRAQFEPHLEKLLRYLSHRISVVGDCWEFQRGTIHKAGYGIVNFRYDHHLAHRLVYAWYSERLRAMI